MKQEVWIWAHYDSIENTYSVKCYDWYEDDASTIHPTEVRRWDCLESATNSFSRLDYANTTCGSCAPTPSPTTAIEPSTPAPLTLTPSPAYVTTPDPTVDGTVPPSLAPGPSSISPTTAPSLSDGGGGKPVLGMEDAWHHDAEKRDVYLDPATQL